MPAADNLGAVPVLPTLDEQIEHLRVRRNVLDQRIQELEALKFRRQQISEKVHRIHRFSPTEAVPIRKVA